METTLASDSATVIIHVPRLLWARLVHQLRRRGKGTRESGAFLLAPQGSVSRRITGYVCYDDLDPKALETGAITFHAPGYAALWERCLKRKLEVLADVHTHPGGIVRQSSTDQRHPMIPMLGHTAIILPSFAQTPWWSLDGAGVYEYLGDFKWRTHPASAKPRRVTLTLW
jgi:proteasome lid subunit RPN8/RPN11